MDFILSLGAGVINEKANKQKNCHIYQYKYATTEKGSEHSGDGIQHKICEYAQKCQQ